MLATQWTASSRKGISMIGNPPINTFVSGKGPAMVVPSTATIVHC